MRMIPIPKDAYMRMRSKGRYLYAVNRDPIVWNAKAEMLLPGEPVYCVSWTVGQHRLVASKIVHHEVKPK